MGRAQKKIKDLEAQNLGETYQDLRNKCNYWKYHYKMAYAAVAERDVIITKLRFSILSWKRSL